VAESKASSRDKKFKPVDRLWKKLRLDNLWVWILKLLIEENKYAYELRQEIKERFKFEPATVTAYAVLYRLERQGYVSEASRSKTPNRKYYEITDLGREAYEMARTILKDTMTELFNEQ
jgi:DNA-binding PadR family transcriptional regulator